MRMSSVAADRAGFALVLLCIAGIAVAGALLSIEPLTGFFHWLAQGSLQAVAAALLAYFCRLHVPGLRHQPYFALLGGLMLALLVYDVWTGAAANRTRIEANAMLTTLRDKPLDVAGLADAAENNGYVDAYFTMRDLYWELYRRADDRLSEYNGLYRHYVEDGGFLDIERLESRYDLWLSYFQIGDLEHRLDVTEETSLRTEDLLWSVDLLEVDAATRGAYAGDMQATIEALLADQADSFVRQREALRHTREAIEVLLDADGRYRVTNGQIVFDDAEDAIRFAGKTRPSDTAR